MPSIPHASDSTITFVYDQPPGEPVLWPLGNEQEAMLLQHYIEQVALFVRLMHVARATRLIRSSST